MAKTSATTNAGSAVMTGHIASDRARANAPRPAAHDTHATVRRAVDVDACLAPGILVAELQGHGPTEGVTEYSHARHVEPSSERSGRIRRVQPSEAIEHERDIAGPRGQDPAHTPFHLSPVRNHTCFRVVLLRPSHYPAVGEHDASRAIGGIEAHHDVPVAGQILGER